GNARGRYRARNGGSRRHGNGYSASCERGTHRHPGPVTHPARCSAERNAPTATECDTHCTAVKDLSLPNNARLISWNDEDAMGGHLAYYVDGKLRDVANFEFK